MKVSSLQNTITPTVERNGSSAVKPRQAANTQMIKMKAKGEKNSQTERDQHQQTH